MLGRCLNLITGTHCGSLLGFSSGSLIYPVRLNATTREPAPIHSFERIQLGDVGYTRRGRFHLLFSAGCPLGERQLGADVPLTFEPLRVGPIVYSQPRLPGHLSTKTVRETGAGLGASISPVPYVHSAVFVSSSISFELTEKRGAALVTKHSTYREDAELELPFKKYTKRHYSSWVTFARNVGHGDDIRPILITGVDMTRDFAMMAYVSSGVSLTSEFTISAPVVASISASAWGTWRTEGLVHTNCGPQLCRPPSSTQITDLTPPGSSDIRTVPDEYNQCVFVRYYTIRKRFLFPAVMRAAAGPHDLGPGDRDYGESPQVETISDSDSDSDSNVTSSLQGGEYWDDDEERDDVDIIAEYIFQVSSQRDSRIHLRFSKSPLLELKCRLCTHPSSRHYKTP